MLEGLQQCRTAALCRPASIGADRDENDQLTRKQTTDTVQHKSATSTVLLQQLAGERLNPTLTQTRVMAELKSLQRSPIHGQLAHAAHEDRRGGI